MKTYIDSIGIHDDIDENSYLAHLPAINFLAKGEKLDTSAPVTIFVGENGTGKSTLLEGIAAVGFNPEGGSRNFNFSTENTYSKLFESISFVRRAFPKDGFFLRAESFYNVASYIDELDKGIGGPRIIDSYGGVSLHEQSHGESFLSLILNRFCGKGLYLMDEPEAALSPQSIMTLIAKMGVLIEEDSQFIIATHSPMLMAFPGARVYEFSKSGIEEKDYRETGHFQLMKSFMQNPDRMMRYILENEE